MLSEKPWNLEALVRLLMGIFFCIAVVILAQAAVQHFVGKDKFDEGSLLNLVFVSLGLHGSILFGTAIFLWWYHLSWREAFGFTTPSVSMAILLGVMTSIIFLPVGMVLQGISLTVLSKFHIPAPPQPAVAEFDKVVTPAGRAYLVFFAVILAPFAEEVFFRGILYPVLKRFGRPQFALWGSALAFGLVHLNPPVFLPLVVFGLFLAWLYEKTGNLLATITAHAVFNATNLVLMFYGDRLAKSFPHMQ